MAHFTQDSSAIVRRYETHHSKTMTLLVTRQHQQFIPTSNLSLGDLELIRSSVELVGEPGLGGNGVYSGGYDVAGDDAQEINAFYGNSINMIHGVNDAGIVSTVRNRTNPNRIEMRPDLNHGWVNVDINGMTQGRHFLQDDSQSNNQLGLVLPTDLGLLSARIQQSMSHSTPIKLENVQMQQRLTVDTSFVGTGDINKRVARFTEDLADTDPATYRNTDGTVKYFEGNGPAQGANTECQIPSNCINMMLLQFKVHPRSTV